jgi:hypothetical protein
MRTRITGRLQLRSPRRTALGVILVLHALAHAGAGIWASQPEGAWAVATLWWIATAGFLLAGAWLLGIIPRQGNWQVAAVIASMASLGLIVIVQHPAVLPGAIVSLLIAGLALGGTPVTEIHRRHRRAVVVLAGAFVVAIAYVSTAIMLRPWHMRWGASDADLAYVLPGDDRKPAARYRADHAITIHAPVQSVWPWLVQLGQDRAGFYSYDRLERAAGADVHNVDEIVPEWQRLARGQLVRAVPPDWMGGRFGSNIGWRVAELHTYHALVLEGWGAFVLVPLDDSTTRLIVRTRGEGRPTLRHTFIAPLGAFVFEPAHFIMQRKMLLTIKSHAERVSRSSGHSWIGDGREPT